MKLSLKIVGGILFTFLITNCADQASSNSEKTEVKNDEKEVKNEAKRDKNPNGLNIAYYVQDSIGNGFDFYREIDSMLRQKQRNFEGELRGKYESYQRYESEIQKRAEANEITGYEIEGIEKEMMRRQQSIANFERQRGGQIQKEAMDYQTALMNKISEAGKEFSEEHGYDLLFFYQKGGQITYISNAYDVTEEFIAYLNERESFIKTGVEEEISDTNETEEDNIKGLDISK
jgi:outer membrane protein